MDNLKEAFKRVKEDILDLKNEMIYLRENLTETRNSMIEICEIIKKKEEKQEDSPSTSEGLIQTNREITSTQKTSLEALKPQNMLISTGNEGVSTDRQTDTSTDRQGVLKEDLNENSFENAIDVLNSLDSIKKEIRLKFKKITEQELLVFSTIYQIEEEIGYANYKVISDKLKLTQSSIRDHVRSLINKGIPVDKNKIGNKQISLSISENLKKIAPLSTILTLRDI